MSEKSKLDELREILNNPNQGTLLEAKDAYGIWYPAKVIDIDDDKVRVHFCNWSSRYDTWYPLNSDCLHILHKSSTKFSSSTKIAKSPSIRSPPTPKPTSQTSDKTFEPGTYVMAFWKNQYEYLAEVLAHRCRQHEKAEYRIRFIWDNVIEWTPAHKVRKATQFEIDYVLKFCREHGGSGSATTGGQSEPVPSRSKTRSSVPTAIATSDGLTTRSQATRKISSPSLAIRSPSISSTPSLEQKAHSSHGIDGLEQDGMVYDKTVLQFHEACRKRRELKRQAIAIEQQSVASSTHTPQSNPSAPSVDQPLTASTQSSQIAGPNSSPLPTSPLAKRSSGPLDSSSPQTHFKQSPVKAPPATPSSPSPPKLLKSMDSPKLVSESDASASSLKPIKQTPVPPTPPVNYPCPFCPRILRHSKLLAAHLANYHKDTERTKRTPSHTSPVSSALSHSVPPKAECNDTNRLLVSDPRDLQLLKQSAALLICQPCDTRRVLAEPESGLVKCESCLCWMHRSCYHHLDAATDHSNQPFYCHGCRLTTRPARPSRLGETSDAHWMRTGDVPWSDDSEQPSDGSRKLIPELTDLLNWSYKLQPLLHTGWNWFHNVKLPESSPKKPAVDSSLADAAATVRPPRIDKQDRSDEQPPPERSANDDQVNKLYMEFRASVVVDNNQGTQSGRQSVLGSLNDEDPAFTGSLPDSANCWPLTDDTDGVDPSCAIDTNLISTHVLTGFLQDLGPNVISELVDLGAAESSVANGNTTAVEEEETDVGDFLDDSLAGKHHSQYGQSTVDTPTKGLGPLLSSPNGVASLLQATIANSVSTSNRTTACFSAPTGSVSCLSGENVAASCDLTSPCVSTPDPRRLPSTPAEHCLDAPPSALVPIAARGLFEDPQPRSCDFDASTVSPSEASRCDSAVGAHQDFREQPDRSPPVVTPVVSTEVDWLPISRTITTVSQAAAYELPFHPALSLAKADTLVSSTTSSMMMYDTSFALDTIMTDVLTPDAICEAQSNLDYLDEYILAPLERALFIMESQLDAVTEQLAVLEQPSLSRREHGGPLGGPVDCNSLFSDGSSPFGSSSSFSLSPAGPVSGESPTLVMDMAVPNGVSPLLRSSQDANHVTSRGTLQQSLTGLKSQRHIKQTARQLYRYTMSRRPCVVGRVSRRQ